MSRTPYKLVIATTMTLLALVLTACSSGDNTPSGTTASGPESEVTTQPTASTSTVLATPTESAKDLSYPTVAALKDAAVAAGYVCPAWKQDNQVTTASESGHCSGNDVFSVFPDTISRDQTIDKAMEIHQGAHLSAQWLIGPNWTISADLDDLVTLRAALGGELKTYTAPAEPTAGAGQITVAGTIRLTTGAFATDSATPQTLDPCTGNANYPSLVQGATIKLMDLNTPKQLGQGTLEAGTIVPTDPIECRFPFEFVIDEADGALVTFVILDSAGQVALAWQEIDPATVVDWTAMALTVSA